MKNDLRIALAVLNAPLGQTDVNLSHTLQRVEEAAAAGVDIICFPETNVTGYTNRDDIQDSAEPVPGPAANCLKALAERHDLVILAGIAERGTGGRVYASHLVAMPDGQLGTYRKLHISPRERDAFTPGDTVPLFRAKGATFGIQLCYDAHFPELSTHMAERGVDLIFVPHASPRGTPEEKLASWMRHLPARAYDNSTYVLACNQSGANGRGLSFPGLALVIGPSGKVLKQDTSGEEGLLVADLSAGEFAAVRDNAMHYFFAHRRPEIYLS